MNVFRYPRNQPFGGIGLNTTENEVTNPVRVATLQKCDSQFNSCAIHIG